MKEKFLSCCVWLFSLTIMILGITACGGVDAVSAREPDPEYYIIVQHEDWDEIIEIESFSYSNYSGVFHLNTKDGKSIVSNAITIFEK